MDLYLSKKKKKRKSKNTNHNNNWKERENIIKNTNKLNVYTSEK